jgi:hypothetical protein
MNKKSEKRKEKREKGTRRVRHAASIPVFSAFRFPLFAFAQNGPWSFA